MASTLELDLLTPRDWRMLRAARLYALLDSPDAFTSSYADESTWSQLDWQRSLHAATWIVAREAQNVIGLAKFVSEPALPASRYVESAWVAPTHRRRGVLRTLLDALAEVSHRMGVTELDALGVRRQLRRRSRLPGARLRANRRPPVPASLWAVRDAAAPRN